MGEESRKISILKATFYKIDIRDSALSEVFEKEQPEAICHLAAQHSVKISTDDPVHDANVNILGLINILQNATRFGVRKIIFSSSGATYGTVEKMPVDESTTQVTRVTLWHYQNGQRILSSVLEEYVWTGFYYPAIWQCVWPTTRSHWERPA